MLVARGRSDGRTVIFVPEVKSGATVGITLLHVRFHDRLPVPVIRGVLQGYDHRYDRLVDWVSETEGSFRDDLLADIPVADLLIEPLVDVADRWIALNDDDDRHRDRCGRHRTVPQSLARTPTMRTRLFTDEELEYVASKADPVPSLAARFAAREAVMKSLGVGLGAFGFHDVWVRRDASGRAVAAGPRTGCIARRRPPA